MASPRTISSPWPILASAKSISAERFGGIPLSSPAVGNARSINIIIGPKMDPGCLIASNLGRRPLALLMHFVETRSDDLTQSKSVTPFWPSWSSTNSILLFHRDARCTAGGGAFRCEVCGETFRLRSSLSAHLFCHASVASHAACRSCAKQACDVPSNIHLML